MSRFLVASALLVVLAVSITGWASRPTPLPVLQEKMLNGEQLSVLLAAVSKATGRSWSSLDAGVANFDTCIREPASFDALISPRSSEIVVVLVPNGRCFNSTAVRLDGELVLTFRRDTLELVSEGSRYRKP